MARKANLESEVIPKRFPMTEAIWSSLGKNKIQFLFFLMFIIICPFLALFLKEFDNIYQMRVQNNSEYNWPKYSDLILALLSSIIIGVIFELIQYFFISFSLQFISQKYQKIERQERAARLVKSLFKGTYFVFATGFAYYVAKDAYFMPKSLGGSGDIENTFKGYPYADYSGIDYFKEYFMIQLGYHFHSFVSLFFFPIRNDFMEMLLHHSMTVSLVSLAYLMNYLPISLLILYCHDISDIFVCFSRVFVDTDFKKTTFVFYVGLMISWVYTRLYIFPFELIRISCYQNKYIHEIYGIGILGAMVHILVVLHVYWFVLLVKMGMKFVKTSTLNDIQHDLSRNH